MYINTEADECPHSDMRLRRRVIRSGAVQYVMQCQTCGEASKQPLSHARVQALGKGEPPDFDEELKSRYAEQWRERHRAKRTEFFRQYDQYLKTPEWAHRRSLVLDRANGICEGCRERHAVEVHHLTYRHVGEEFLFELVALCDECHDRVHRDDGR